jgi:glutamate carboxypeptidase
MDVQHALKWIESQKAQALALLQTWVSTNSWSENLSGLGAMLDQLHEAFSPLGDEVEKLPLPPWKKRDALGNDIAIHLGDALRIRKRKSLSHRILLGGHMDTVYPPSLVFPQGIENTRLKGPGVADMKGGLAVLWLALSAFERFSPKKPWGWDVLITPDEELGSPSSRALWKKSAKSASCALLFEPSFSDGALVDTRKGSIYFTVIVKGRAAHVGRDYEKGRSAAKGLSHFVVEAYALMEKYRGVSLNVSRFFCDSPLNVIPPLASCQGNIRSENDQHLEDFMQELSSLIERISRKEEVELQLHPDLKKTAKPFDEKTRKLYEVIEGSAKTLGIDLKRRSSGGLSDGNILAECGLASIDSLGVIGGNLHTPEEYMEIASLADRAKLVYLVLWKLSSSGI